jgi:superfamily II DNA or RNA helicase
VDLRLIPADHASVRRRIAQAYLESPAITATQGSVQLAAHQVEAASRVQTLLAQFGGAVLADATGLGKTFVALAVARLHHRTLIVAPAGLRGMWRESLGRTGVIADVESYESLSRGCRLERPPALLVLDEAHHARNPATRRYAAIADLSWGANVLLLTATPVHNRRRDLRALLALFLGSRAERMSDEEVLRIIVRRTSSVAGERMPVVRKPLWLEVPRDPDTLRYLVGLPPAVAASDGAPAHALLVLGLIRAWSSSEAALRAALRRRLRRAASLELALESGHLPDRRELAAWPIVDESIQLGFPELLLAGSDQPIDVERIRSLLREHVEGVRAILRCLDRHAGAADEARATALGVLRQRYPMVPVVAFSQFAETAVATYRRSVHLGGVALVTGRGARIASGPISVDEIVRAFDSVESRRSAAMPLSFLVSTDVLSEGLSLRRAGVLVHLDLPWTMARLEQRVGRLRRLGSAHESIAVYAIGPPVSARELMPVVRALQRKARVSSSMVGDSELQSSLPLFGHRLHRATSVSGRIDAHEKLRGVLTRWLDGRPPVTVQDLDRSPLTLGLIANGGNYRLVAVDESGVTESPDAVVRAVERLSATTRAEPRPGDWTKTAAPISQWLDEQRGRELARLATDSPSPAHAIVLRAMQEKLRASTRTERATLAPRIDQCRQLVLAARGVGAERALSRLGESELDLDALEQLLRSRTSTTSSTQCAPRLVAILSLGPDHSVLSGYVQEADGE